MGKKLAFWGDCNGYGYKIIRILEELGGINVSNYAGNEVVLLYYIDNKSHIECTLNGKLDKEKYVVMTYHDFIAKYPFQVGDIVYATNNHEEGKVIEIVWGETKEQIMYLVDFKNTTSWMYVDEIFAYEPKDNSKCGTAIKPMKVKSNAVKRVDDKVVDNLDKGKTMNKKLAIKGHPTRGKEVIKLLEMMDGVNSKNVDGKCDFIYYFIDNDYNICYDSNFNNNFAYFTIEEFLEKYPFKVGDKFNYTFYTIPITVKSMSWCEDYCTMVYDFVEVDDVFAAEDLLKWNMVPINKENKMKNVLAELLEHIKTTPKEDIEREFEELKEWSNVGPTIEEFRTFCERVNRKPKYPKTYKECCEYLRLQHCGLTIDLPFNYSPLFISLAQLYICRNAYWKIAGEQMGLDKPWEPKFGKYIHYSINFYLYKDSFVLHKGEYYSSDNRILVFPTEEMRDAFYENFKDLIEECKELL